MKYFAEFYDSDFFSDTIVECGTEGRTIRCHAIVLAKSPFLRGCLQQPNQSVPARIVLPDWDADIVEPILKYCYGIPTAELPVESLIFADVCLLPKLCTQFFEQLVADIDGINGSNVNRAICVLQALQMVQCIEIRSKKFEDLCIMGLDFLIAQSPDLWDFCALKKAYPWRFPNYDAHIPCFKKASAIQHRHPGGSSSFAGNLVKERENRWMFVFPPMHTPDHRKEVTIGTKFDCPRTTPRFAPSRFTWKSRTITEYTISYDANGIPILFGLSRHGTMRMMIELGTYRFTILGDATVQKTESIVASPYLLQIDATRQLIFFVGMRGELLQSSFDLDTKWQKEFVEIAPIGTFTTRRGSDERLYLDVSGDPFRAVLDSNVLKLERIGSSDFVQCILQKPDDGDDDAEQNPYCELPICISGSTQNNTISVSTDPPKPKRLQEWSFDPIAWHATIAMPWSDDAENIVQCDELDVRFGNILQTRYLTYSETLMGYSIPLPPNGHKFRKLSDCFDRDVFSGADPFSALAIGGRHPQ